MRYKNYPVLEKSDRRGLTVEFWVLVLDTDNELVRGDLFARCSTVIATALFPL